MKPLFNPATVTRLESIASNQPHAVILSGPHGVGLTGAAQHISETLGATAYTVLPEKEERIDRENGVISVASIRRLYEYTRTKTTSTRLVVIDYAERMGAQAQNAFLKLLEEPTDSTMFLMLTHEPNGLLPTVRSRAQSVELKPISEDQSNALLDELGVKNTQKRAQLLFVARGLPAELKRLASDDEYFEARAAIIRDARTFLQGRRYEKLQLAQAYKDNRPKALLLVKDAMTMLEQSAQTKPTETTFDRLELLLSAYERIEGNGNIRLQLAKSVV